MPKFLCIKTFKKLTALTLIAALLLNPIAHATSSYIEVDSQESDATDRLHTMMPLSHVQDISHIEIDSDEQRVRIYRDTETTEDNSDPETSSQSPRESVVEVSHDNIYNLPWHLGQEGLLCFLSQHTAWLTPLSEGEYKLEFKGRLLGGMWGGDSSEDSGGYSNDYDSGSYSSNNEQSESDYYECDSNGRCIPCITIYADSSQPTYNDQSSDYGRSYGKSSDGGSSSSDTSSSSNSYTNTSSTNHHSRPATRKPAAAPKPPDLSKLFARLNIKPPAKSAPKPAPKIDLSKLLAVAKPAAKPAAPVAKPIAPNLSKLLAVPKPAAKPAAPVAKPAALKLPAQLTAKPVAKPAAPVAKPVPKIDLSKLLAAAKPPAKPAATVAKPVPKVDLSKLLAVAKPAAKPAASPAKPAPSMPIFTQLESIRQAAAQKAQQQKKITEVVQVLQAMNREGLISQNLFTVPAFLSSYTPEKLEVLLHQLRIFIELAKDDASLNRVIQTWQAEDEKRGIFVSPGDAEFIQVKMGGCLGLFFDMIKNGPQKTKDILRNVTEIYKRETTKRFIQKDWKKDLDIPQGWNKTTADNAKGVRYRAPPKKSGDFNEVRVMKGQPKSDYPGQRVDYVKLNNNGKYYDINGNIVSEGSQEAHIPLKGNEKVIENLIKQIWK